MTRVGPLTLLAACLVASSVTAEELRPSWECLPEQTAVMVRLPQAREFVDTLMARTKFGSTLLGEQRLQRVWKALLDELRRDDTGAERLAVEESLAKYGLEPSDPAASFAGDMGFALVVQRREEGRPPLQMLLAWLEPGEGPAGRMLAAAERFVEERQQEGDAAPTRVDLQMAGRDVMCVTEKVMGLRAGDLAGDAGDDLQAQVEALQERIRNAASVQVGVSHSFVARIGGRLLVGQTLPAAPLVDGGEAPADRDWDEEAGTEEARGIFERFLAAHVADGASALVAILGLPGVRAALPEGLTLVDVVADPRVLMASFGGKDADLSAVVRQLESLGLSGIGPFVWRQSFAGGRYHNGMFISMPAPRRGLMQILDQDCDTCEPPSFVTSEATDLTQFSLDLGQAYRTVREVMVVVGGEEAGNMFTAAEMQAQGWLGLELPQVLTALGSRHWMIAYPSRIADAIAAGRAAGNVGQQINTANRGAIVWQVADEAPFVKILQRLAPMAGGALTEEQGFRGLRIPNGPAVFLGMNHLVVGIGDESLEKTIAGIRNPPAAAASLREGDLMQRAAALLPLDPARMFSVGDAGKTGGMLGNLRDMAAALQPEDVPPEYRGLFAAMKEVLPGAADMEGMFGASVSTMRMTDDGLVVRSAWEMPPP